MRTTRLGSNLALEAQTLSRTKILQKLSAEENCDLELRTFFQLRLVDQKMQSRNLSSGVMAMVYFFIKAAVYPSISQHEADCTVEGQSIATKINAFFSN